MTEAFIRGVFDKLKAELVKKATCQTVVFSQVDDKVLKAVIAKIREEGIRLP